MTCSYLINRVNNVYVKTIVYKAAAVRQNSSAVEEDIDSQLKPGMYKVVGQQAHACLACQLVCVRTCS